jgi:hypothetical protein
LSQYRQVLEPRTTENHGRQVQRALLHEQSICACWKKKLGKTMTDDWGDTFLPLYGEWWPMTNVLFEDAHHHRSSLPNLSATRLAGRPENCKGEQGGTTLTIHGLRGSVSNLSRGPLERKG